MQASKECCLY